VCRSFGSACIVTNLRFANLDLWESGEHSKARLEEDGVVACKAKPENGGWNGANALRMSKIPRPFSSSAKSLFPCSTKKDSA
jgi:hypothetical protein